MYSTAFCSVGLIYSNLRYKSGRLQVLPDVYRNVFYFILEVSCASLFYFKN
jgi:hypothetical protein